MDNITDEGKKMIEEVLKKYGPVTFACFDKEGCAVMVHDLGRADAKGFANAATNIESIKYVVYIAEKNIERVFKHGGNGTKRVLLGKPVLAPIYDFDELTYSKAMNLKTLQLLVLIVQRFLDNYPECLKTITVINAPFYYEWFYNSLKPLLPITVIRKVRIYGSVGWKEKLLEDIEADDLPAYLGGNKTDPDGNPLCETFIIRGQLIPKKYYRQKGKKKLALESDVIKITLLPFSKKEITLEVKEVHSFLEWELEIKSRDIDFYLLSRGESPKDFEPVELIPKQRIDTTFEPEKGYFKCDKVGSYTIVFDNSYSWFHSKEVYYRIKIKSPKVKELLEST